MTELHKGEQYIVNEKAVKKEVEEEKNVDNTVKNVVTKKEGNVKQLNRPLDATVDGGEVLARKPDMTFKEFSTKMD